MRKSVCVLLFLAAATNVAGAQQSDPAGKSFAAARARGYDPLLTWASVWGDQDRQGVYTCEEWKRYAGKLFDQADRNRDGFLDTKEFESIRKADPMLKDADLAYFDDNRDGKMSRAEFVNKPNPFFAQYDRKGTCRVTLDDVMAATEAAMKARQGKTR
jgi:EF hand domain-containing protein